MIAAALWRGCRPVRRQTIASSPTGPPSSDDLINSASVVVAAAHLLHTHWEALPQRDREQVLDRLEHHARRTGEGLQRLVRTYGIDPGRARDRDRIDELEEAAVVSRDRIEALEAAALDSEAAALVSDARILELASEVERLRASSDQARVIDQAKSVLMRVMQISEDAAFAVLVAASQRDNVTLHTVARQIAASRDRPSSA